MSGNLRVSVIIPFYNDERFLTAAIESVLAQTFRDFEVILVDDGGRDSGRDIARNYAARMPAVVRCVTHDGGANLGCGATRNRGVELAHGQLVALLDADDVWTTTKLAEQVAIFDRWPGLDLVAGATRYWRSWEGGHDELKAVGPVQGRPVAGTELLLSAYPLGRAEAPCPSSLMIRRDTYLRVGGSEPSFKGTLQLYEDQTLLAKIYLTGSCFFSEQCWLWYRQHDRSCMASSAANVTYAAVRAHFLTWFADYLRREGVTDREIWHRIATAKRKLTVSRIRTALRTSLDRVVRT